MVIDKQESAQNMAALHVEAKRSLGFLEDEYDDLYASCKDTKQLISRLSTRLSQLSEKVQLVDHETNRWSPIVQLLI